MFFNFDKLPTEMKSKIVKDPDHIFNRIISFAFAILPVCPVNLTNIDDEACEAAVAASAPTLTTKEVKKNEGVRF